MVGGQGTVIVHRSVPNLKGGGAYVGFLQVVIQKSSREDKPHLQSFAELSKRDRLSQQLLRGMGDKADFFKGQGNLLRIPEGKALGGYARPGDTVRFRRRA